MEDQKASKRKPRKHRNLDRKTCPVPESSNPTISEVIPLNIVEDVLRHSVPGKINGNVCRKLSEHCSFKLKEVIKAATDYMAQCGRLKFTIEDFNRGLILCGETPMKTHDLPPPKINKESESINKNPCNYIKEMWLNDISQYASINNLSDELQNYFNALKEVLFLNNEKTSMILSDIQTNKNIFQLIPCALNFFCDAMNKFECEFLKVLMLLKFLRALLKNPHLYFNQDNYLSRLSCALLKFLAADLPHYNQTQQCWLLKDIAANLLAIVLRKSNDQHLFFETMHSMEAVLSFTNTFNSHYGVLVALNSIGVGAVFLLLPSYNHRFQEHVKMSGCPSNQKIDFHMVKEQIVRSYHLLMDYFLKNEFMKKALNSTHQFSSGGFFPEYLKDIDVFPILSQSSFSDFFGEALIPSLPLSIFASNSFLKKKQKLSSKKNWQKSKNLSSLS